MNDTSTDRAVIRMTRMARMTREQMIDIMSRAASTEFDKLRQGRMDGYQWDQMWVSIATIALDSINQWATDNPETIDELQSQRESEPTPPSWQCYCKDHPTCTGPYCHMCGGSEPSSYDARNIDDDNYIGRLAADAARYLYLRNTVGEDNTSYVYDWTNERDWLSGDDLDREIDLCLARQK